MSYRFQRNGRSLNALSILAAIWVTLLAAWWKLDVVGWILGLGVLVTVPAAWDFVTARPAGLELDDTRLTWWSGRHRGDVRLDTIDHVRFETRLDLSVRVRLVLANAAGTRVPIPQDAVPRWQELQDALSARGIDCRRHHFGL